MTQVFLVTTMWDEVDETVGLERLNELKATYWKGMVSRGSTPIRYDNNQESAKQLLQKAAEKSLDTRHLMLQKEVTDMKIELRETEAGQKLCSRLEELADRRLETLKKLREEQSKSSDVKSTEELRTEYAELKAQLDDTLKQVQSLRMTRMARLRRKLKNVGASSSVAASRAFGSHSIRKKGRRCN